MTAQQQRLSTSSALALHGVSDELLGIIAALKETPSCRNDNLKFIPADTDKVAQDIVCRNYANGCLRLSYLLAAVLAVSSTSINQQRHSALLQTFWLDEMVTSKRFRDFFAAINLPNLSFEDSLLKLRFNNEQFDIAATQVGYLAALLEFLVNVIPGVIDKAELQLMSWDNKAIKGFASWLQKSLYDFLDQHLSTAQHMRRIRFMADWLAKHNVELGDESVLSFWQQVADSEDDSLGFKRFRTVAENFVVFAQAVAIGQSKQALAYCASIGYEAEQGELNPEHLANIISDNDEGLDVSWLAANPKFLSKQQALLIEPLIDAGSVAQKLPLTLLRSAVFGDWQAQVVQALRSKDASNIATKLSQGCESNYSQYLQEQDKVGDEINKVQLALAHIFLTLEQSEFFSQAAFCLPEDVVAECKERLLICHSKLGDEAEFEQALSLFYAEIAAFKLQHPNVNQALQQAQQAFARNNRQGFKLIPEVEELPVYRQGGEVLAECSSKIAAFAQKTRILITQSTNDSDIFAADLAIFSAMFNKMYEV